MEWIEGLGNSAAASPDMGGGGSGLLGGMGEWWDKATAKPEPGSFWDRMGGYMAKYGGPEFGMSDAQRANILGEQKQNDMLKFIKDNTVAQPPLAPMAGQQPQVDEGGNLLNMSPQALAQTNAPPALQLPTAASVTPQQQAAREQYALAMQPKGPAGFPVALEQELAVRGGYLPQYMQSVQNNRAAMERQQQEQLYKSGYMTAYEQARHNQSTKEWDDQKPIRDAQAAHYQATSRAALINAASSASNANVNRLTAGLPTAPVGTRYEFDKNGVPTLKPVVGAEKIQIPTKPQAGYESYTYPDGSKGVIPSRGTDDWRKAKTSLDVLDQAIAGATKLARHYQEFGTTEIWNKEAAMKAEVNRQAAITGLGELNNMGVLQPGDLDRLSKQLQDPTDTWSNNPFQRRGPVVESINEVRNRLIAAKKTRVNQIPTIYEQQE